MNMTLNEYQRDIAKFAVYPGAETGNDAAVNYCLIGVANEAGELLGHWKKKLRGDGETMDVERLRQSLLKELGDVLWYVARASAELGVPLEDIAAYNLDKLVKRLGDNKIKGSGDDR